MTRYSTSVNVSAVKRALKTGRFGKLQWQAICARPDSAARIVEENRRIESFEKDQTGLSSDRNGSIVGRILAKAKKMRCDSCGFEPDFPWTSLQCPRHYDPSGGCEGHMIEVNQ